MAGGKKGKAARKRLEGMLDIKGKNKYSKRLIKRLRVKTYCDKNFIKKILPVFLAAVIFGVLLVSPAALVRAKKGGDYPRDWDGETGRVFITLSGYTTGLLPEEELRLAEVIVNESRLYNLDPFFIMALIKTESTFYNFSRSEKGATGLMQVLPATAKGLAKELNITWEGGKTLYNPYENVRIGTYYFSQLLRMYRYDKNKALLAYGFGPSFVEERQRSGASFPEYFQDRVFLHYKNLKEGISI